MRKGASIMATAVAISESPKMATTLKQVGQRRDYQMIDPRMIDIEPGFNSRDFNLPENKAHFARLKAMILASGRVEKAISVRLNKETGRATVVDGETRLRIVWELIAEGVHPFTEADMPCYPAPPGCDDPAVRLFASLSANEGKPLSKLELGRGYQALFDLNISIPTIANKTANSEAFVRECIELANAPDEVKQLLSSQAVSPAEALRVIRSADVPAAVSTLQATVQAKQAKGEKGPVKRSKAPSKSSTPAPAPVKPSENKALTKAIYDLLSDVPVDDLDDKNMDLVYVKRTKLLKLASFAVTADELKEQMATVGATVTAEAQF
jgi:ParB-like chromosome segregation protein Spo0J